MRAFCKIMLVGLFMTTRGYGVSLTSNTLTSDQTSPDQNKLTTTVSATYTQSTLDPHDELATRYQSIDILAAYVLPHDYKVSLYANADQEIDVDRQTQVGNAYLGLSHRLLTINDQISIGGEVRGYAPTNQDDERFKSYRGSLFGAPSLRINLDPYVKGLTLGAKSSYKHNFYKYADDEGNKFNLERAWTNSLTAAYTWMRLTASVAFANISSWNTDGNRNDDSYQASQELAIEVTDHLSVAAGHQIADRTFEYNGLSNNMRIFDVNNSEVYGSVSYTF